jgi:hypothetical protein
MKKCHHVTFQFSTYSKAVRFNRITVTLPLDSTEASRRRHKLIFSQKVSSRQTNGIQN